MLWVKIGNKWIVRENRILSDEDTAYVLGLLEDPILLICEICVDTSTRISEVLGLQRKHFDLEKRTIKIAQRHCRGDVDEPKTESSRRTLVLCALEDRCRTGERRQE